MPKAVFIGSFDPLHVGHVRLAKESVHHFGDLLVVVCVNADKESSYLFSFEERLEMTRVVLGDVPGVTVQGLRDWNEMPQLFRDQGVEVFIRGIHPVAEQFEREVYWKNAFWNREMPELWWCMVLVDEISSTQIREAAGRHEDVSALVPPEVVKYVERKFA